MVLADQHQLQKEKYGIPIKNSWIQSVPAHRLQLLDTFIKKTRDTDL
jgi:hypothetical protein